MKNNLSYTEIELAIAKYFDIRKNIVIPNISFGFNIHECDLFIIKPSGYVVEVEIKRSISDLKADFKKKHKHEDERIKELFFAVPDELYEKCKDLIPEDAGILVFYEFENKCYVRLKRAAKKTSGRKLTDMEKMKVMRLGCLRIWSLKEKIIKK